MSFKESESDLVLRMTSQISTTEDGSIAASGRHVFSEDDDEQTNQIYLSVFHTGSQFGASYYDLSLSQLYLMKDQSIQFENEDIIKSLLKQVQPKQVIVSAKANERFVEIIKSFGEDNAKVDGFEMNMCHFDGCNNFVQFAPSLDFSYESAKTRILRIDLPNQPKMKGNQIQEKAIFMRSMVDFDQTCAIQATGALLRFLDRRRIGIDFEENIIRAPILAINQFSLENSVLVGEDTLRSLKIFHEESHPSVYKSGKYGMKEGLSLFGIFRFCQTSMGRKLLRLMFLRPTNDLNILNYRLNTIKYLISPCNDEVIRVLLYHLKQIKNISRLLSTMAKCSIKVNDWIILYKSLFNMIMVGKVARHQHENVEIFVQIACTFTQELDMVADLIQKVMDFDESLEKGRFSVKIGINDDIDEKKRTYNGLSDLLTSVATAELSQLNENISECNALYLPQLGYLIAIPMKEIEKNGGSQEIEGLDFIFASNEHNYYKSKNTRDLDEALGDTQWDISDEETKIMHWLQDRILEHLDLLLKTSHLIAELDCLLTMSIVTKELNLERPTLVDEEIIDIKGGRHILQELLVNSFVHNDTHSESENGKISVITGPNASGKSVYIKQVALIVYLAHIGSYVPAKSACIGLVDKIFARLEVIESVSVGLSTFVIDLNQISAALRNATSKSLVIIDEFGKGTCDVDGLSLLASTLNYWIKIGPNCPHVFLNTHFHTLRDLLQNSNAVKFQTMDFMHEDGNLVFLYKLKEVNENLPVSRDSFSYSIALTAGLKQELIDRAKQLKELQENNQEVPQNDAIVDKNAVDRCHRMVDQFLELDLDACDINEFMARFLNKEN